MVGAAAAGRSRAGGIAGVYAGAVPQLAYQAARVAVVAASGHCARGVTGAHLCASIGSIPDQSARRAAAAAGRNRAGGVAANHIGPREVISDQTAGIAGGARSGHFPGSVAVRHQPVPPFGTPDQAAGVYIARHRSGGMAVAHRAGIPAHQAAGHISGVISSGGSGRAGGVTVADSACIVSQQAAGHREN